MNFRNLLDSLLVTKTRPGNQEEPPSSSRGFLDEALSAFGLGGNKSTPEALHQGSDDGRSTLGDWTSRAKDMMGRNPALTAGGVAATAGMLLSGRGRGLLGGLAGVGAMGLIGALAYNAFQKFQERRNGVAPPNQDDLNPARASENDVRVLARAMVAAIACDGRMDSVERARVTAGLKDAGVEEDGANWLESEFRRPASVADLASQAETPEKAVQIYSAARLVIEPDTEAERAFLKRLAEALKLDPALAVEIDGGASDLKGPPARG